jgi:hypothetical protein
MMRRLFWLGAGVAVGALVVRKLVKTAEAYTPAGLADSARTSVSGFVETIREIADDIKVAMAEREDDLFAALATDGNVSGVLDDEIDRDDQSFGDGYGETFGDDKGSPGR